MGCLVTVRTVPFLLFRQMGESNKDLVQIKAHASIKELPIILRESNLFRSDVI